MPETFLSLPVEDRADIINAGAARLGRSPVVLEKDVWVCWALHHLFSITNRPRMAFKGGTSLSKVFDVIHRFSEAIDITIDYRDLGLKGDPFDAGISRGAQKRFSDELKALLKNYAQTVVKPHLESALDTELGKANGAVRISDDGEKLWVDYPSGIKSASGYMRSNVLIELGGRNITEPNQAHSLTPYLAVIAETVAFPDANPDVLAAERTFWEKATLIHVECNRKEVKDNAERMVRHWSDLAMLAQSDIGPKALADRAMLASVVKHKNVFFYASYANYEACLNGGLRLVPDGPLRAALKSDLKSMVDEGMFFGDEPDFEKIIEVLADLEKRINA